MTGGPLPTVATVSVAVQGTTVATVEGDLTLGWASELISYFDVCSVAQAEQVSIHPDIQIWDCLLQSLLGLLPVQGGKPLCRGEVPWVQVAGVNSSGSQASTGPRATPNCLSGSSSTVSSPAGFNSNLSNPRRQQVLKHAGASLAITHIETWGALLLE